MSLEARLAKAERRAAEAEWRASMAMIKAMGGPDASCAYISQVYGVPCAEVWDWLDQYLDQCDETELDGLAWRDDSTGPTPAQERLVQAWHRWVVARGRPIPASLG